MSYERMHEYFSAITFRGKKFVFSLMLFFFFTKVQILKNNLFTEKTFFVRFSSGVKSYNFKEGWIKKKIPFFCHIKFYTRSTFNSSTINIECSILYEKK